MRFFKSKSAPKEERPTYIVIQRWLGGQHYTATTPEKAMAAFEACVSTGHFAVGSPRRAFVTGPDYCVQPDDISDPLLIGTAALRAVLAPAEYAAYVQAPLAAALLES